MSEIRFETPTTAEAAVALEQREAITAGLSLVLAVAV
jgi:hypothetical protein